MWQWGLAQGSELVKNKKFLLPTFSVMADCKGQALSCICNYNGQIEDLNTGQFSCVETVKVIMVSRREQNRDFTCNVQLLLFANWKKPQNKTRSEYKLNKTLSLFSCRRFMTVDSDTHLDQKTSSLSYLFLPSHTSHDPVWEKHFRNEALEFRATLPGSTLIQTHVGSGGLEEEEEGDAEE